MAVMNPGALCRRGRSLITAVLLIPFLDIRPLIADPFAAEQVGPAGGEVAEEIGDSGSRAAVPTIIITPQWRAMDPQDVPVTAHILPGKTLDTAGIGDTIDLQYLVPGMVLKTNSVLGQPYLRGIGSAIISPGSEASVATFVDGVYQARAVGSIQDFYDLDRVEVLKGPQGVQLGRNVVGGAISVITHDPEPYYGASADILYGSYDKRQFRGMLNVPISDSHWALRIAGTAVARNGYTDNIYLDQDVDNEGLYALRGKLRYAPSNDVDIVFGAEHSKEDSTRGLGHQPDPSIGVNGGILLGGIVPDNPRKVTYNVKEQGDTTIDRYSLRAFRSWNGLGIRSTTAYQASDIRLAIDLDGTNVDYSSNFPKESSRVFAQELRVMSQNNAPWGWQAGVYYLYEDATQALDVRFPLVDASNIPDGTVDTDAYAVFGQVNYHFSSAWEATVGLRYSYDRRKIDLTQTIEDPMGALGPAGTTILTQQEARSWDAVTPELTISYTPQPNRRYYVRVARGFKSGGFNTSGVQPAFDPEYLWAYEVGLKTRQPALGTQVNTSLFYYDYQDIQLEAVPVNAPPGTFPIVINAAKATITGLDLELTAQPTWQYAFGLGLTLMDARFDKFVAIDANNPSENPDHSGDPLPQAPDVSLNADTEYRWAIGGYGEITLRGEYRYQSSIYFNGFKDPAVKQDGYDLVSASLAFDSRKGNWYAELFGRNLTDELYAQTIIRQDPIIGTARFWGAPRTFGFRIGYKL